MIIIVNYCLLLQGFRSVLSIPIYQVSELEEQAKSLPSWTPPPATDGGINPTWKLI